MSFHILNFLLQKLFKIKLDFLFFFYIFTLFTLNPFLSYNCKTDEQKYPRNLCILLGQSEILQS
jgi:hypothetical protein